MIGTAFFGKIDEENHIGTGMIGKLIRNESDFSIIPFAPDKENIKYVSFTNVVSNQNIQIVSFSDLEARNDRVKIFKIYSSEIWILIGSTIVFLSILHGHLLERFSYNAMKGRKIIRKENCIVTSAFVLVGSFFRQSIPLLLLNSNRLFWFHWIFAAFCLSSGFVGVLQAVQTVPEVPPYVNSLKDILDRDHFKIFVLKDTPVEQELRFSNTQTFKDILKRVERDETFLSVDDLIDYVASILLKSKIGGDSFSTLLPTDYLIEFMIRYEICDNYEFRLRLHLANQEPPFSVHFAFPIRRGFTNPKVHKWLQYTAEQFFECGTAKHISQRVTYKTDFCFSEDKSILKNQFPEEKPLDMRQMGLSLMAIFPGLITALVAFVFEAGLTENWF